MTARELATLRTSLRDVRRRIASGTASASDHALVPVLTAAINRGREEVQRARGTKAPGSSVTPAPVPTVGASASRGSYQPREVPSRIREIIAAQQVQLRALDRPYALRLRKLAEEAQRELTDTLRGLAPGRFSAQQTRVVLAQVRGVTDAVGARYGIRMSAEMRALSVEAGSIGRESLLAQIDEWGERYTGSVRAIARVDLAAEQLRPALLEYHSAERYTAGAIHDMRDLMSRGSLSGESLIQTADQMAGELGLTPYQAERIVRTEASRALHIVQADDMTALFGEDAGEGWLKQLVATFDDRTGADSKFVHGQAVALDGLFRDNEGREYELPPNRPNDREAVVHVPKAAPLAD